MNVKELPDEEILNEYERFQKLKLHSILTEDESHIYTEIIREIYHRRIGHYKDYDGPKTTGLDDKPYQMGCRSEEGLKEAVESVMIVLKEKHLTIRESHIVLGRAVRQLLEIDICIANTRR